MGNFPPCPPFPNVPLIFTNFYYSRRDASKRVVREYEVTNLQYIKSNGTCCVEVFYKTNCLGSSQFIRNGISRCCKFWQSTVISTCKLRLSLLKNCLAYEIKHSDLVVSKNINSLELRYSVVWVCTLIAYLSWFPFYVQDW